MSTANDPRNSLLTSEAYDLLDCCVSGFDDVLYEIAESIAVKRGQGLAADEVIEINRDDIRAAAEVIVEAIREQAGKSIPESAVRASERIMLANVPRNDVSGTPTNDELRRLAKRHRPPQAWLDSEEEDDLL